MKGFTPGGTSLLGGRRGAWPQNLPLKLVSEPQILPPKILVARTPNFGFCYFRYDPKSGIPFQFLSLVVTELPKFFFLYGDLAPNFAFRFEARSKPPRPLYMEVPPEGFTHQESLIC